jgi:hypothetical protein
VSWPGHLPPGRVAEPFPVEDTLVHVAELGGIPLGPELSAQIARRPALPPGGAVTEYDAVAEDVIERVADRARGPIDRARLERTWAALEQGPWKLVVDSTGEVRLFDVVGDPGEDRDARAEHPEEAERLRAELAGWQERVPEPARRGGRVRQGKELREGLEALGYVR